MKIRLAVLATTLYSLSITGFAAQSEEIKAQVEECAQMKANIHRLSCYDDLAKGLGLKLAKTKSYSSKSTPKAPVSKAVTTTSVVKVATAESEFGIEHVKEVEGPDTIDVVVKKVVKNAYGERKFYFENGQIWRQMDSNTKGKFSTGTEAIIKRGALGAFYLKKEGSNRTIKVKRIK